MIGLFSKKQLSKSNYKFHRAVHCTSADIFYLPWPKHHSYESFISPLFSINSNIYKGQPLCQDDQGNVFLHSPCSGWVKDVTSIEGLNDNHNYIVIESDKKDIPYEDYGKSHNIDNITKEQAIDILKRSGVAGLGGAGFFTATKWSSIGQIDSIIVNAIECDPYLHSDKYIIKGHLQDIIQGIKILRKIWNPKHVYFAIKKDQYFHKIEELKNIEVKVSILEDSYPVGYSKILASKLTGINTSYVRHISQLGILVHNVSTIFAIKRAIEGYPLIERVVSVCDETYNLQKTFWVQIGTPVGHLLSGLVEFDAKKHRVVVGGSMMGRVIRSLKEPIDKTTNGILLANKNDKKNEMPCVKCSLCEQICPVGLSPHLMYLHIKAKDYKNVKDVFKCIECGLCDYICPSNISLVNVFKEAKNNIMEIERKDLEAKLAKERFERRQKRLAAIAKARSNIISVKDRKSKLQDILASKKLNKKTISK